VLALGLAAAGGVLWWRARSDAATGAAAPAARVPAAAERPEARGSVADGAAERNRRLSRQPSRLPTHELGAKVYADAVAAGEPNPGEKAFRADALAFYDHNTELGDEKAAREGVTVDELKELTVLGLVAMHLRRWNAVTQVTGRELTADERARGDELVFSASKELKAAIREHVAKGDSSEARWATIRKLQASFVERYKALVKISDADYDRLLAQPFQPGGR
jgi:hypothetical protein